MNKRILKLTAAAMICVPTAALMAQTAAPAEEVTQVEREIEARRAAEAAVDRQIQLQVQTHPDGSPRVQRGAAAGGAGLGPLKVLGQSIRKEKAAFLGVVTTPVTAPMREQLKLPKGVGLIVETVEKDSPAEAAGIKQYDILQKIDDQWVVNSQQFAVLIRMHKPGESISVSGIRQAQPQVFTAKLVEKELAMLEDTNPFAFAPTQVWGGENYVSPLGVMQISGTVPEQMDVLMNRVNASDTVNMTVKDEDNRMTLTISNGKRHLVATNKDGEVIFDGPIDTEAQRKALPPEIAAKVAKLKPALILVRPGSGKDDGTTTAPAAQP